MYRTRDLLTTVALATAVWCLHASCSLAQTPAWKFAEGDSFTISIKQGSTVQTIVDRRVVDQTNDTTMTLEWNVENLDGENARIRQTITRVVSTLTMPGEDGPKTIEYDSDAEKHTGDARRMAKSFSRVVDQPVFVTMNARGHVLEVEIPEETLESLRQMPGSMQGRKMFELESIRETFSQAGMQFPESIQNNSWSTEREFSIGTPQKLNQTFDYTIADATANPLEISFTGNLELIEETDDRPAGIEFENLEIDSQESSGTITFDTEAGNCLSSNSTTMLKTRTRYRDMDVVATINSRVELTVTRN